MGSEIIGLLTSMHAENLIINDHAQREEVEHIGKVVPHIGVPVLPRALGVESIRLRNSSRLVVSADQMHAVGVSKLQTSKKGNRFNAEHASVNIVTWMCVRAAKRGAAQAKGVGGNVPKNK